MGELSVAKVMETIVPITRFNKGEASKIFKEVRTCGTKIVIKNNSPECVLMAPEHYETLMEMLSDYIMQEEADARMSPYDPNASISQEEMMTELGIAPSDLEDIDVEIV